MKQKNALFSKETRINYFWHPKIPRKLKKAMNKCYFLTNKGRWYMERHIRHTKLMKKAVEYLNSCKDFELPF